jgi:hypothetical protein
MIEVSAEHVVPKQPRRFDTPNVDGWKFVSCGNLDGGHRRASFGSNIEDYLATKGPSDNHH